MTSERTAKPAPPPWHMPDCSECPHPAGVHALVGKDKHRGPCSSGHGPKGEPCPCPGYVPQIRAEATT